MMFRIGVDLPRPEFDVKKILFSLINEFRRLTKKVDNQNQNPYFIIQDLEDLQNVQDPAMELPEYQT